MGWTNRWEPPVVHEPVNREPVLTPAALAALEPLTAKRRIFVFAYVKLGNAIQAAKEAGYKAPHPEGSRLLRIATVRHAIAELSRSTEETEAFSFEESVRRLERCAARLDDPDAKPFDRNLALRAQELIGKWRRWGLVDGEVNGTQVIVVTGIDRPALEGPKVIEHSEVLTGVTGNTVAEPEPVDDILT